MTTNLCDHIRQRALEHGKGNPEYDVWVHHSRKCSECRDLLAIQQLLEAEGEAAVAHLPQESVKKILEHSHTLYANGRRAWKRPLQKSLVWAGRIAACAVVACAMFKLSTPQPTQPTLITASRSTAFHPVAAVPAAPVSIQEAKPFAPHPEIQISPIELTDWNLERDIVAQNQNLAETHDMLERSIGADANGDAFLY